MHWSVFYLLFFFFQGVVTQPCGLRFLTAHPMAMFIIGLCRLLMFIQTSLNTQWWNFFFWTLNIITIKYLPEIVFIAFQKVWPHQKHSNKWKPYCCLLLIRQNKILQILVVLVLAHSGCAAETSTRTEQCTYGIWLHVGDCTNIHCTWRLQTDSSLRYSTSQMHELRKKRFPPLYNLLAC